MNFRNSPRATPLPNPPPQGREQVRDSNVTVAWSTNKIFAANRAVSRVDVAIDTRNGVTRLRHLREEGSLRIRFPRTISDELEAVLVNTAGGIAGGDDLELRFAAGPDTRTVVTGAAAEKIYRSLGADANIRLALEIGANAKLAWLPQELILFDGAQVRRSIEIDLAPGAHLLVAEGLVFGRAGMGEKVERGLFLDRWRVRRGGRLLFADAVRLDGAITEKLAARASTSGAIAIATVLVVPAEEELVHSVRKQCFSGEVGISAWNGFALARLVAPTGAMLRQDLTALLMLLRQGNLPRLWMH